MQKTRNQIVEQNNSNTPIVKVGDTIYESDSFCDTLSKRKVERITKTQIILDNNTKLRNNPLRMYGDRNTYYLNTIGRSAWNSRSYYIENEELIKRYENEQLYLETKKKLKSLNLEKLTDEQLNILLAAISQVELSVETKSKSENKENQ